MSGMTKSAHSARISSVKYCQVLSLEAMLKRSLAVCTSYICGPNEMHSKSVFLEMSTPHSNPAWMDSIFGA